MDEDGIARTGVATEVDASGAPGGAEPGDDHHLTLCLLLSRPTGRGR